MPMKAFVLSAIILLSPLSALAQTEQVPQFSIVAGVGNAVGGVGGQAEGFIAAGRFSLFVGAGYAVPIDTGAPSGVAFAAGARAFALGPTHRVFCEFSWSWLGVEKFESATDTRYGSKVYGPGVGVGYSFVARSGLTALASVGVGFPVRTEAEDGVGAIATLGLGYTWRGKR